MKLHPYLTFNGNCEAAMNFYKDVLDGEITIMSRFDEAPPGEFPIPDFAKKLIMHLTLEFRGCTIMASDTTEPNKLKMGSNVTLSINADDADEGVAIFNSLLDGGQAIMPFQEVFWGGQFGMLVDQFGVQWMVSTNHNPS
ncbi:MAG: VOC family protein [Flavobacteriaceae bacterium]|nr:MAG: VOC family protein [Flavobacteriaceae bacterium]